MSAAVADYTPAEPAAQKVKKSDGPVTITLHRTKDILGDLGKLPSRRQGLPVLVGFAAETSDVVAYAKAKLQQQGGRLDRRQRRVADRRRFRRRYQRGDAGLQRPAPKTSRCRRRAPWRRASSIASSSS